MAYVSVNGKPVGMMMYEIFKRERTGLLSPVKNDVTDSVEEKLLKSLISAMISFEPKERPTIDQVLKDLQFINGTYSIQSLVM